MKTPASPAAHFPSHSSAKDDRLFSRGTHARPPRPPPTHTHTAHAHTTQKKNKKTKYFLIHWGLTGTRTGYRLIPGYPVPVPWCHCIVSYAVVMIGCKGGGGGGGAPPPTQGDLDHISLPTSCAPRSQRDEKRERKRKKKKDFTVPVPRVRVPGTGYPGTRQSTKRPVVRGVIPHG